MTSNTLYQLQWSMNISRLIITSKFNITNPTIGFGIDLSGEFDIILIF